MQNRELSKCKLIDEGGNYKINFIELEELEKIAKISKENKLIVVSDEIHSDVIYDGYKHTC